MLLGGQSGGMPMRAQGSCMHFSDLNECTLTCAELHKTEVLFLVDIHIDHRIACTAERVML